VGSEANNETLALWSRAARIAEEIGGDVLILGDGGEECIGILCSHAEMREVGDISSSIQKVRKTRPNKRKEFKRRENQLRNKATR